MSAPPARRVLRAAALGLCLMATVAACAAPAGQGGSAASPSSRAATSSPTPSAQPVALPEDAGHVHALARDPGTGALMAATHTGLYVEDGGAFTRIGPAVDLMGFTVAGAGRYFGSGHPQPGTSLPNPLGLIESRDGGRTWQPASRGGDSDFHAMTAAGSGVVAFDGALRRTDDGSAWQDVPGGFEPISLAGAAGDERVVASTAEAVLRSEDAGRTWEPVPGAPAPVLVSRADDAVVAVDAQGQIHQAAADGTGWSRSPLSIEGPMALVASGAGDGLEIVVLTAKGLRVSRGGGDFVPWTPAP